jgi:16S rRNA (adenine1518-N6/adenine1519-N6)-dimethyltransferase
VARQKLGQHFLTSAKVLERIAQAACGDGSPLVVEIGPGKGALTGPLLKRAERIVAIEFDRELAQFLREHWRDEPRLEILEANAMDVDWSSWGDGVLAGNLPYYLATALISKYVRQPGPLKQAVFLIQKEVAERITAVPGTREYGYFSVECQLHAQVQYLFTVAPGAFRPPPKVESAVICLTPQTAPQDLDTNRFLRFVSACFRQKRKTLRNNLAGHYPRELLDTREEADQRAEQLSVPGFVEFYRALTRRERVV